MFSAHLPSVLRGSNGELVSFARCLVLSRKILIGSPAYREIQENHKGIGQGATILPGVADLDGPGWASDWPARNLAQSRCQSPHPRAPEGLTIWTICLSTWTRVPTYLATMV